MESIRENVCGLSTPFYTMKLSICGFLVSSGFLEPLPNEYQGKTILFILSLFIPRILYTTCTLVKFSLSNRNKKHLLAAPFPYPINPKQLVNEIPPLQSEWNVAPRLPFKKEVREVNLSLEPITWERSGAPCPPCWAQLEGSQCREKLFVQPRTQDCQLGKSNENIKQRIGCHGWVPLGH